MDRQACCFHGGCLRLFIIPPKMQKHAVTGSDVRILSVELAQTVTRATQRYSSDRGSSQQQRACRVRLGVRLHEMARDHHASALAIDGLIPEMLPRVHAEKCVKRVVRNAVWLARASSDHARQLLATTLSFGRKSPVAGVHRRTFSRVQKDGCTVGRVSTRFEFCAPADTVDRSPQ